MTKILTEVTPLSEADFFYLVDRTKDTFTFPIHRHDEFELNFVQNAAGAMRVVGDSFATIGDFDLCLLGQGIEHAWQQHECKSDNIHEITIQFSSEFLNSGLLQKKQFASISAMLKESSKGILFSPETIMKVYASLDSLVNTTDSFEQCLIFLRLLHVLSLDNDRKLLSSSSFSRSKVPCDSRRVRRVQEHIESHYGSRITLEELADIAGMAPTSFSRFFRQRTGRSVQDYITEIRLGHASRALVEGTATVAEICYGCGFNNISNFNRLFKKKKKCTPKEFRELYRRNKIII